MKKILFLLFISSLFIADMSGQVVLKADTFAWNWPFGQPTEIGDNAQGTLFFTNVSHNKYRGYVSAAFRTNFDTSVTKAGGPIKVSLDSGESSFLEVSFNKSRTDGIDYPKFHPDTVNIVVVWPTGNGFTADSTVIKVYLKSYSAISPVGENISHLRFFPNPSGKIINFDGLANNESVKEIEIYDLNGKMQNGWSMSGVNSIDFGALPIGEYIALFRFRDGTVEKYKLIRGLKPQ